MVFLQKFLLSVTLVAFSACGGGSGGDVFSGAADLSILATPNNIDTGDNVLLEIRISNVHESGIALKIRYPAALEYVRDSSILKISGKESDISPKNRVRVDEFSYLVYYLSHKQLKDGDGGEVILQLKGVASLDRDKIEVDADVDDPLISNDSEFDPQNPFFEAQAEANIAIS